MACKHAPKLNLPPSTPTEGPLRVSSKLLRRNSTKKGKNRRKRPPTHVHEEAIKEALEDFFAAEKMANMAIEEDSHKLACKDDGSLKSSARSSGSETKLGSSTDGPVAKMKAKVMTSTVGRTKHERGTVSEEFSVDGLSAQESARMRSATLRKIKHEKSRRNGESSIWSLLL